MLEGSSGSANSYCGDVDIHTLIASSEQQQQKQHKPFISRKSAPTFSCVAWRKQVQLLIMEVDSVSAARWRRERRLRQILRHERLCVAMALSEYKHHTSRGGRTGPGGGFETHYTAKFREHPPPSWSSSSCLRKSPAAPASTSA